MLLAGPTILYLPVYLAWLNSAETIKGKIRFWTPPDNAKVPPDRDPLMEEYYGNFAKDDPLDQDVLLCIGDPVRDAEKPENLAHWQGGSNGPLLLAGLINQLPVRAYKIPLSGGNPQKSVYLTHRKGMTTNEIAVALKSGKPNEDIRVIGGVNPGYEDVYINALIDKAYKGELGPADDLPAVYLVGPQTIIKSTFSIYPEDENDVSNDITNLGMGEKGKKKFLLTGVLKGASANHGLRSEFLENIEIECGRLRSDPERSARIFHENVKYIDRFHHANLNELISIAANLSNSYSFDRCPNGGKELLNGLKASLKVRRTAANQMAPCRCPGITPNNCPNCAPWRPILDPFLDHERANGATS